MLHISGWFDSSARSVILAYYQMSPLFNKAQGTAGSKSGNIEKNSETQFMIIGPWTHGGNQHVRTFGRKQVTLFPFDFSSAVKTFVTSRLSKNNARDMDYIDIGSTETSLETPPNKKHPSISSNLSSLLCNIGNNTNEHQLPGHRNIFHRILNDF
jgi:hypothetical protein